jgi:3-hydroxybutyryl-CoA dehydrogenase
MPAALPAHATVAVIGAGAMGAGIAQVAAVAGHKVQLHDARFGAGDAAKQSITDALSKLAAKGRIAKEDASAAAERITSVVTLPDACVAQLVVEAIVEDTAAKRELFARLENVVAPECILATNTSSLSITELASGLAHPGRLVGMHFFNPAPVMPLVEVVAAPATSEASLVRATAIVTGWGKVPVRCGDAPGFIVNRVNRPFTLEALAMLATGEGTVDGIDAAVRAAGYPMGPFELMDLIGVDINLAAALGIYERTRRDADPLAIRFRPSPIQERLVAEGRLGRKTGAGFYAYDPDGRPVGAAQNLSVDIMGMDQLPEDTIAERITLAIINEAYRALGDGVARAADIDLAMRLGASHPAGPFERTRTLGGTGALLDALRRYAAHGPRLDPAPALLGD